MNATVMNALILMKKWPMMVILTNTVQNVIYL